jgi:hypothetical protein
MRSAFWLLNVKNDVKHVPNKSRHAAIKKEMLNTFFQSTEVTFRVPSPFSFY